MIIIYHLKKLVNIGGFYIYIFNYVDVKKQENLSLNRFFNLVLVKQNNKKLKVIFS